MIFDFDKNQLAQLAHVGWGMAIPAFAIARIGPGGRWWVALGCAGAWAFKEFVLELWTESPQTRGDKWKDFAFLLLGTAMGLFA